MRLDRAQFFQGVFLGLVRAFQPFDGFKADLVYQVDPVEDDVSTKVVVTRCTLEVHVAFVESEFWTCTRG